MHLLENNNLSVLLLDTINATLACQGLMLKTGNALDANLIAAACPTKNKTGERGPEMHQFRKGKQWHFGMKAPVGVDAELGLVQTLNGTAANVKDVTQGYGVLHGEEALVFADAGYHVVDKRSEATGVHWNIALRLGSRRALDKQSPRGALLWQAQKLKGSVRTKLEPPFRVIKCLFGFTKVRYCGLAKKRRNWWHCLHCPICGWRAGRT